MEGWCNQCSQKSGRVLKAPEIRMARATKVGVVARVALAENAARKRAVGGVGVEGRARGAVAVLEVPCAARGPLYGINSLQM